MAKPHLKFEGKTSYKKSPSTCPFVNAIVRLIAKININGERFILEKYIDVSNSSNWNETLTFDKINRPKIFTRLKATLRLIIFYLPAFL